MRSVRWATLSAALLATGVGLVTGWSTPGEAGLAVALLALGVALSEIAVVHLQFGRQRWTFSCTEGAIGAAWVVRPGAWTAVGVVLGVLVAQLLRRQPVDKTAFNLAQFAAATTVGALVAQATGGGVAGACAGLGGFFLVNHNLVGWAVATTTHRAFAPLVLRSLPVSAVHTAGNASIGLLAAYLAVEQPLGLLGLVVPLGLLWSSYEQQTRRDAEARLFAELATGQEQSARRTVDTSAQVVLGATARLYGGADVELLLLAPDGPVRYCGDEHGTHERVRVGLEAFDEPWALQALGAGGVTSGVTDRRPWVAAALGAPGDALAVMRARRPVDGAAFGRRDLQLAGVLVGQAESWLSLSHLADQHRAASEEAAAAQGAARALGDVGAATAPALAVLRESADRLALLSTQASGLDAMVEELHLVERAVASLLGAVALAADPDLAALGAGQPGPDPARPARRASDQVATRPSEDWTTTGVLR